MSKRKKTKNAVYLYVGDVIHYKDRGLCRVVVGPEEVEHGTVEFSICPAKGYGEAGAFGPLDATEVVRADVCDEFTLA